jgi:excisionase family DNA binding protein
MQRNSGEMADGINFSDVQFLTVAEVADLMRVSKMTVYRLVHAGDLPAVQFGRSYRVPESAVEEFLQRAQVEGQSESA